MGKKLDLMEHVCNPDTQEAETEGWSFEHQPELHVKSYLQNQQQTHKKE